jgi:hypothetical protein
MKKTLQQARRAYDRALRAELHVVDALGDHATKAPLEHAWTLAAATNAALRNLQAAREAA